MHKRVLLIYPPTGLMNREDRCQVPTRHVVIAPPLPPTDLMYMAALAEDNGATCKIIDYTLSEEHSVDDVIKDIEEFNPDYLILSTTTPTVTRDLELCKKAKEAVGELKIIAKGAHFLKFDVKALEEFGQLDMVIRGEAEWAIREILCEVPLEDIGGLTWRAPGGIVRNPERVYTEELDSLPFPARHLVDNSLYVRPDNNRIQGTIKVARGCPFDCFFCLATAVSGTKVRMRSPENILAEVRECIEKYNIRDFLFWSDIFNVDRAWVEKLCTIIIDSGLKFNWATNTRTDTITLETARLMRRSGCSLISVGIESGSQELLNKMGKNIDIPQIKEAFAIFKKAGLKSFAYYIIGLPWETRETFEETIRLAIYLDSDFANFFTATAFPGTRFFDYAFDNELFAKENTKLGESYEDAYYYPTIESHYLDKEEIAALHDEAVRRYFLRPGYIIKSLFRIRSITEFVNYARAALAILKRRDQKEPC